MLRALLKAGSSWPIGQIPGGPRVYHELTCGLLGSQSFHAPKLARAWTRYAQLLQEHSLRPLSEVAVWVHECGWTPISALAGYLVTGRGVVLSNTEARVRDRYLHGALDAALCMRLATDSTERLPVAQRRARLLELRGDSSAQRVIAATGGRLIEPVDPRRVPLPAASIDFCHTGNAIEHYRPDVLRAFLQECYRVLRPGGIASHVVDHRDHLHHVDRKWPYLFHLSVPDRLYECLFGHDLLYHNRYSPDDMMALFASIGFERIDVRRATADREYSSDSEVLAAAPGLPGWATSARGWSQLDLRTAYAHYVYRKPVAGEAGV